MRKKVLVGIAVVLVAAASIWFAMRGDGDAKPRSGLAKPTLLSQLGAQTVVKQPSSANRVRRVRAPMSTATNKHGRVVRVAGGRFDRNADKAFVDDDGKPYPMADQKIMRAAQQAMETDNLDAAIALAGEALNSKNVELRGMVVDALGWFGKDALVELLPFISDRDEDVAENARSQWLGGLQEIEDDGEKAGVVEVAMRGIRDKDAAEEVMDELVGIDELAAVQVVVNVILDGKNPSAVKAARKTYNTITGEDFSDVDAAEAWLQKNYEKEDEE